MINYGDIPSGLNALVCSKSSLSVVLILLFVFFIFCKYSLFFSSLLIILEFPSTNLINPLNAPIIPNTEPRMLLKNSKSPSL